MTDPVVVRMVVGGLILIILSALALDAFASGGGDVYSDTVKISLGALAGILARVGPSAPPEVEIVNRADDPVPVDPNP